MRVKVLFAGDVCDIVAPLNADGTCDAELFLIEDDPNTEAAREGLRDILGHVADMGIANVPSAWHHEANKKKKVHEFIKGPLRLFYFKGEGRQVAVCTCGAVKKGQKADKGAVNASAELRKQYEQAVKDKVLEVVEDGENDE